MCRALHGYRNLELVPKHKKDLDGEARADRELMDGRKGKIMTPSCGKKCFPATEIIVALTLACSCMHAQASKIQTFSLSGVQDLDARNVGTGRVQGA